MTGVHPAEPVVTAAVRALHDPGTPGGAVTPERVAESVVGALVAAGYLPSARPTPSEVEDVARWLADQADSPRYTMIPGGWKALLSSEPEVAFAHGKALRRAGVQPPELNAARDLLLRHVRR